MWTTLGNAPALTILQSALAGGRVSHAYLFSGPEGVGKKRAALEFAAALNCAAEERPCGECRSCRDTLAGRHTDVEIVEPGGMCDESDHRDHSDSRDLRICQVRRLERVLSLTPYGGGWRVAIVDAAETLTPDAANAFLKTLEEPPPKTVLILIAKSPDLLPETVLSRCQVVPFSRLPVRLVEDALVAKGASPEVAASVARASAGKIGWACRTLEDETLLERRGAMRETAARLPHAARSERLAWAAGAARRDPGTREAYREELDVWEAWWRDVLAAQAGAGSDATPEGRFGSPADESRLYRAADVVRFLRALDETRGYLAENVDSQLALENLILALPRPRSGP